MTTTMETETVHTILSLARHLSTARRQWVAELLRYGMRLFYYRRAV